MENKDEALQKGLYPEIQPLHIDPLSKVAGEEDNPDFSLRPDTVDEITDDDFTDDIEITEDIEFTDETGDVS